MICIGCRKAYTEWDAMDWQMCGEDFTRNTDHTVICPVCQDKLWNMERSERLKTLNKWRCMK